MPLSIFMDFSHSLNQNCFTPGRDNHPVLLLVCHNTAGPNDLNSATKAKAQALSDAAARYLSSNDRQVSAHWLVGAENCGAPIYRIVPEGDTAHHCGGNPPAFPSSWKNPGDNKIYGGFGLNQVAIGIEVFGQVKDTIGPKQEASLKTLVQDITRRYSTLKNPGHIVAHAELEGDRTDGLNWIKKALAWTNEGDDGDCIPLSYKVVVPRGQASVRTGPGRTFPITASLKADPNRQYQVDCEKHGELIGSDDVWSHIPELDGYVTRTALQILQLD